ncbi:Asp-tRNA(Asn)/Glu-tRNA(Gln) amidotransferase subunit GatA [Suttonella sp. R2A3]|uniref:Asp-tRNA(Asn)/Glu-tRNA(Gln) amidotransferase subunit GatA n=1 Tax=Suttonella sp. R2A3 TaxID=2908648 RepID=UPI0038FCB0D5
MHQHSVAELSRLLAQGETSAEALCEHYLARIQEHDSALNSFIRVEAEHAKQAARESDKRRATGKALSPLDGIPMAHKDLFCTKNIPTTAASKMLESFVPSYSATIVEHLERAGAVMLGKLSMDEFAMGSSNERSYFGAVKNPWNHEHIPGGSSGGSAAAVAARLVPYATGSDTGGSIRQPAAFCGVTGIKPTYGTLSRYGMIAFASSLDQPGPLAASAEDLALILNQMSGFDPKDSTASRQTHTVFDGELDRPLQGLTIGLPKAYFADLDPTMSERIHAVAKQYEALGATLKDITLEYNDVAIATYYLIASAEASSNLSRYDGVRYGYRCDSPKDLLDLYQRSRGEGFGDEVKRRIMIGTHALSAGYYDAYYEQARRARRAILDDFNAAFNEVDVILGPTTPTPAFKLGDKTDDPVQMFLGDLYTVSVNLAGLPAISHPAGFINGLPVGAQLIGAHFSEPRLLSIAHQYQQVNNDHRKLPEAHQ